MCHDAIHGSNIEQGVIMISTPDLYYQEFKCQGEKLKQYKHEFLARVDQYYKLKKGKSV
jgi:genome maintenance exonuclease 1